MPEKKNPLDSLFKTRLLFASVFRRKRIQVVSLSSDTKYVKIWTFRGPSHLKQYKFMLSNHTMKAERQRISASSYSHVTNVHTVLIHIHGREHCQINCILFIPQNKQHLVFRWVFADVSVLPAYRSLRNVITSQQTTGCCLFCVIIYLCICGRKCEPGISRIRCINATRCITASCTISQPIHS